MRIAIAWDGSLQAMRALHAAVPLLEKAEKVILLIGGRSGPLYLQPYLSEFDLNSYCERHRLKVQRVLLDPALDPTGGTARAAAVRAHAELLVMGAFDHTRMRERLFCGVTQDLLRDCPMPVLLRH